MCIEDVFLEQAHRWALPEPEGLLEGVEPYVELLSNYETSNVVGTRDPAELLLDHVLDALSCFIFRPLWQAKKIADVGSGAGLPGIPLKIASPKLHATLIESTGKKARFLRLAVQQLGLADVHIENKRVEELAFEHEQRAGHDVATVRAVAALPVLAEYCVPLLRDEGYVIAMKGAISPEELRQGKRAAQKIGARLIEVITVPMHQKMRARVRRLVIMQKVRPTPKRYPRRAGMPKQRPLCGG